jgi:glycosyltransferase involved in cell wall biosynthesis
VKPPAVDVVMTAWNAERFIEEAVRSVLEQTVPVATIVVVDDGSTDQGAARAAALDPKVRVLVRQHEGIGASREAGIAVTSAPFVALLDCDDLWLPRKLERQLAVFDADPSAEAVFCLTDEFHDFGDRSSQGSRAPRLGVRVPLSSAALLRREVIERIGPFGSGVVGDWFAWWASARAAGIEEHVVPEVLVRRRIHGDNNSLRRADNGKTFLDIARKHLRDVRAGERE